MLRRLLAVLAVAALAVAGVEAYHATRSSSSAAPGRPVAANSAPLLSEPAFQERSGVRIVRVAVAGDGGLVDVRYQVLDPETAASVHDKTTPPDLVDEGTGVLVNELFMGHMHHGPQHAAQRYALIFNNPGNLVRRGSRVTVQLGAARLAHVRVQ
jgi:hypothetical protein